MKVPLVDLKRQYARIKTEIKEAIDNVLESGEYMLGENVRKFEEEFANYCGVKYGVGVNSGTDALTLSLQAIGIKPGDEVITVPNSFVSTANCIVFCGAKPVFVDVEPDTLNLDPEKLKSAITEKTKAIIVVHMHGHSADMDAIKDIAERRNIYIVEDACQAHGALYKGKKVGSFGDIACFSFYPTKNLGGYGDGGMVVTNNEELADKVRSLRNYGRVAPYIYRILGYNSRLDELQAALLRVKLKYLDVWNEERRRNAKIYSQYLSEFPEIRIPIEKEYAKHVYWVYVIRTKHRDKLQNFLNKNGVETMIHYPVPIHLQECYSYLGLAEGSFPVTERASKEMLSLPMFPELTEEEIEYVVQTIKQAIKH
jgi:dTDP-4-amino-4,6-dideoxygalactose transaminase